MRRFCDPSRHAHGVFTRLFPFIVLVAACGDSEPAGPGDEDDGPDATPPTVVSTDPGSGATGVSVGAPITATFSEDMDPSTVNATTFALEPTVSGTVEYDSRSATFTPSDDLDYGTSYSATITAGVRDEGGNALSQDYTWDFTTGSPPVPIAAMPLETGRRWRYNVNRTNTVCALSTGCSETGFAGQYYVHVDGQEVYEGRNAWRVMVYQLETDPGSEPGFTAAVDFLAQDDAGLWKWFDGGGEWRQILSHTTSVVNNATFFLAPGPNHDHSDELVLGTRSVGVAAGSFTTVRALYDYEETGRYATSDIFETGTEDYADGVGLVLAKWDYSIDDNDPQAADYTTNGAIALTHMDTGPFPDMIAEVEANDTSTTATATSAFSIVSGDLDIQDPGAIVNDSGVGCSDQCIFPNELGEKKIQDWYRLELTQTTDVRVELDFDYFLAGDLSNDLDLYVFRKTETGLQFDGASLSSGNNQEILAGTIAAGTYYLAIQAWSTPGDRVSYWLSIR